MGWQGDHEWPENNELEGNSRGLFRRTIPALAWTELGKPLNT
jgi:hypothetical protein